VELDVQGEQHDQRHQQLGADAENRIASHATACPSHKFRPAQKSYDFRLMTEIIT
jgi:hypothetical protein